MYVGEIEVVLTAVDIESGVDKIYHTVDGTNPGSSSTSLSYVSPATVKISTPVTLRYYSKDKAGNAEDIQEKDYVILRMPEGGVAVYPNYLDLDAGEPARIVFGKSFNAEIRIYTMRGVLVKHYPKEYHEAASFVEWDGRIKDTSEKVGGGIYVVVVKGDEINKKIRMVIRK